MKLLMVNYEFPPIGGGAASAHLSILREYSKMPELKVDVLTSAPQPGLFTETFAENITIHKVGLHKKQLHYWRKSEVIEWLFKAKGPYRKLLKENNYNLVHAFFGFPSGYLCYKTAKRLPYIISLRGSDVPGKHARLQFEYKLLGPLFRSIWKKASTLVACSEGLKQRALRFMPSAKIDVVANGVDLESFQPLAEKSLSRPLKFITVGRLSATKRIELLIEAIGILSSDNHDIRLMIVGGGSLENQLRQLAAESGLDDVVTLIGRAGPDRMPGLYRESDIYVSATAQEGMSNAMLEAMASGLPIVTTRCEGLDELIADNGIIVQEDSAVAIAGAIKSLCEGCGVYENMAGAARRRRETFSWEKAAEAYVRLYERVLSGGN